MVVNDQAVTIEQNPAGSPAVIDGTATGPVITTEGNALLTLDQLELTNGKASFGGGIDLEGGDATITDSTITANTATTSGGGIGDDSYFNLIDSTVSDNTAPGSGMLGGAGGGIAVSSGADDTVVRSTISGNTAGGVGSGAQGGGIVNEGGGQIINNSTISGNMVTGPNGGGGGVSDEGGDVTILESTISGNTATSYGAAIENVNGVSVAADILADAGGPPAVSECQGSALDRLGLQRGRRRDVRAVLRQPQRQRFGDDPRFPRPAAEQRGADRHHRADRRSHQSGAGRHSAQLHHAAAVRGRL